MRPYILLLMLLLGFPLNGVAVASTQEEADLLLAELPEDLSSLRNPFESQLPVVEEIKKTPVELAPQKPDNKKQEIVNLLPVVPMNPNIAHMSNKEVVKDPEPTFVNKGVIWGVEHPYAVIDDTVVGVNDKIKGATVKAIHKNGVELIYKGVTINVRMAE